MLMKNKNGRSPRGQALVEFALLAPVMLVLLLLAVDFGRLFFTYIAVNNAAREATYYASAHAADTGFIQSTYEAGVRQAAKSEANTQGQGGEGTISDGGITIKCFNPAAPGTGISCDGASRFATGIGNQVSVSVSQGFTFLTPIVGEIFGGQVTLRASATAPVLNPLDLSILPDPGCEPCPR